MNYIDLHLHLDGSLPAETLFRLARSEGVAIPASSPEELLPHITAQEDCADLNDYLAKFDIPLAVLQSAEALECAAYELMEDLHRRNIVYAEIRFAPGSHGRRGLTQDKAVEAVLAGVKRGTADFDVMAKVICCCMRGPDTPETRAACLETVHTAYRHLSSGVCCIDLAGAEALFPTEDFGYVFQYAMELGVPCVIHAGEAAGSESIESAVNFGALRIGHGVTLLDDPMLCMQVRDSGVCVEACLTSNLQTRAISSYETHPLRRMLEMGIPVCLNTDNMTVSGTCMAEEFEKAVNAFHLSAGEIRTLQENALKAAFLSDEEYEEVARRLFA